MIWSDPTGNCEAEKLYKLLGIAIAKLSEQLDEFKCHPNNMNHLRQQYINIMAELADSELISDLLSQIHGVPGHFVKKSSNLSQLIRKSNYALS